MVEFVRNNRVLLSQKRLEQTPIRVEARPIQNRVFCPEKVGEPGFELFMHLLGAANKRTLAIPYPQLSIASLAASITAGCCANPR